jgi:hypothetical protein
LDNLGAQITLRERQETASGRESVSRLVHTGCGVKCRKCLNTERQSTVSDVAKSDFTVGEMDTALYDSFNVVPPPQEAIPSVSQSPDMLITVSMSVLLIDLISSNRASLAFCQEMFKVCYTVIK